jgi:hypothetical protein
MDNLNAFKARIRKPGDQLLKVAAAFRQSDRMRQRRESSSVADSLNRFLDGWIFSRHSRFGVVGQIDVKGLLLVTDILLFDKYFGKVSSSNLVAPAPGNFRERDLQSQTLKFRHYLMVSSLTAGLLFFKPLAKFW